MTLRAVLRTHRFSVSVVCAYLAAAGYVTARLWRDPDGRVLAANEQDHVLYQWILAHAAQTVVHLRDPLFTDWINVPGGVNLMANASVWLAAGPLTPVTLTFGPGTAFAVLVTAALAGTATGWYVVLRRLDIRPAGAAVGGAVCGFAPGMLAQATGHPHLASQYLLPFIVATVLGLRRPGPVLRPTLTLSALVVGQVLLGEEALLLTAFGLGLFVLLYAGLRPAVVRAAARRGLTVLGLTALLAGAVLGYPLWWQFAGPQSYGRLSPALVEATGADLAAYPSYAAGTLAGTAAGADRLASGVPEQNAFFGFALLLLLVCVAWWRRREPVPRALALTGVVCAVLSLGTRIVVFGHRTPIPGPWALLAHAPVAGSLLPTRFALVVWTVAGLLLALFVDRTRRFGVPVHRLALVTVAAAVAPALPLPLATAPARAAPHFVTAGTWRATVPAGGAVLVLPTGWQTNLTAMVWQIRADLGFRICGGYALVPVGGVRGAVGRLGPARSATTDVFGADDNVWRRGPATATEVAAVRREARRWRIAVAVLPADHPDVAAIRAQADRVYGPGRRVDDVWVWHP